MVGHCGFGANYRRDEGYVLLRHAPTSGKCGGKMEVKQEYRSSKVVGVNYRRDEGYVFLRHASTSGKCGGKVGLVKGD